jgi:hypothetical protein
MTLRLVEPQRLSLTCEQAERGISLELDRELPASESARLLAHLRDCEPCFVLARRLHLQRTALRRYALFLAPEARV